MTKHWGMTCSRCRQPAFVFYGDRLPGGTEMVTAGQMRHVDGTEIDPNAKLCCDSCQVEMPYGQAALAPATEWVELPPFECQSCGCQWPSTEGREQHQCVHGKQCAEHPNWREDRQRFGAGAHPTDILAVLSAIATIKRTRRHSRRTERSKTKTAA